MTINNNHGAEITGLFNAVIGAVQASMPNASVVAIHDSARPLINPQDAIRCMEEGLEVRPRLFRRVHMQHVVDAWDFDWFISSKGVLHSVQGLKCLCGTKHGYR